MSPVAADCASADSAPGEPAGPFVDDGGAEVAVVEEAAVEAPRAGVEDKLLDEDPQPATTIADASTTPKASLFMARRLALSPDDLLNGCLALACRGSDWRDT
jgi:hypothetical protein